MATHATVDWCENNYAVVSFIAEFWNTLSSFVLLATGIFGWYRHGHLKGGIVYAILAFVGIGSVFFHAHLTVNSQMLDEIPMLFLVAQLYINSRKIKKLSTKLIIHGLAFFQSIVIYYTALYQTTGTGKGILEKVEFSIFQSTIIFAAISIFFTLYKTDTGDKEFQRGSVMFAAAWICWLTDFFLCDIFKYFYLHAWWHILSAFGVYQIAFCSIRQCSGKKML